MTGCATNTGKQKKKKLRSVRDTKLVSFIQGSEESGHTVCKGRKAERTSWILRATTLGFIYTLDVLLSKLSRSVSSK